jgi:hypothetical protein
MTKIWASLVLFSCLGLCACSDDDEGGDDGGDGSGGSGSGTVKIICQADDAGEVIGCNEHTIPRAAEETSREACTSQGGTLVDECPTENFIGKCSLVMGTLVMHYYSTAGDAEDAETMCTALSGTWTDA